MNISLANASFAFCGYIEPQQCLKIRSFLEKQQARFVIFSNTIDILILGDDYKQRHKYKSLKKTVKHCIPYTTILSSIPEIQTKLWSDLYKPVSLSGVIGHKQQIDALQSWLQNWSKSSMKAVLITGPPGIGKTTVVHLLLRASDYECIELNASNERSASAVRHWFEEASRSHHVGKRRVVVMDEVDGMSSGDRGGIGELANIIRTCSFPIICIGNERTPKLRPLMSCCLDVRFARPTRSTIAKTLVQSVVKAQGLKISTSDLEILCERNGNDIRSILNFLQFNSGFSIPMNMSSTKDEIQRVDAFSATGRLFANAGSLDERMNLVFVDFSLVPLMVAEGYLSAASRGPGNDDDHFQRTIRAADYLGNWDILDTRIRKTQNWSMLPSSVMSIVSVTSSAQGPAPFQIFPSWLGKNSRLLKHMRNLRDICRRSGFSSSMAMLDSIETLRSHFFDPTCPIPTVLERLQSYSMTRDDMFETLADTVFKGNEASVEMDSKRKAAITREWKRMHSHREKEKEATVKKVIDEEEPSYDTEDELDIDELI